jgi:hypothetical protein
MQWPAPDVGRAPFPGPDAGIGEFPSSGGIGLFPPQPIQLRDALVVIDMIATASWQIVPWRDATTVVTMTPSAALVPSPTMFADTVIDMIVEVNRNYDNIDAETVINFSATADVVPVIALRAAQYSDGSGGQPLDFAPRWFTASNGYASTYRLYAGGLDWSKPVGLLMHFHGDGAFEYTNPTDPWSLGGPDGIIARAKAENMIVVVPLTPDDNGAVTWWEWWGPAENPQYAVELIGSIASEYNIDLGRMWFSGYSGGAQFITRDLMPALGSILPSIIGGFVVFGGGGAPRREVDASAAGWWQCRWIVGELDDGTEPGDGFNARAAAEQGEAWYRERGFPTTLTVLDDQGHDLGGLFGGHVGDTLAAHRPAYGPHTVIEMISSTAGMPVAVIEAVASVTMTSTADVVVEGFVAAPVTIDYTPSALMVPVPAIVATAVVDYTPGATLVTFTPMGAYMIEQYSGWSNYSWTSLYPLDKRSDYLSTVLAESGGVKYGIVIGSNGSATIVAQATYLTTVTNAQQVRIVRNGTVLATGSTSSTTVATATWTGTLSAGDIITMEIWGDNRGSTGRRIQPGQSVTYLTINPA